MNNQPLRPEPSRHWWVGRWVGGLAGFSDWPKLEITICLHIAPKINLPYPVDVGSGSLGRVLRHAPRGAVCGHARDAGGAAVPLLHAPARRRPLPPVRAPRPRACQPLHRPAA
eukprot:8201119-Pyramimonas_sp.AAC.1